MSGPPRAHAGLDRLVHRPRAAPDVPAVLAVAVLVGLGLLNLQSLGDRSILYHQVAVDLAGVALFCWLRRLRADGLRWLGWSCYLVSVVLLLAVVAVGESVNGARRWLALDSLTVQPSELAKLGMLLVLAQVLATERGWRRRLGAALVVSVIPIGLVVNEPDLSTAAVLCGVTVAMLVIGRIPLRVLGGFVLVAALAAPLGEHLLRPYQADRLHAFLSGSTSANGPGWAILQMHIALAWGGLTGHGAGHLHALVSEYLPDRETDLAFASLVEQHGMIAGVVAVLAAAVLIWRVVLSARHARTRTAGLTAGGFAALVGIEVVVSVAGNLGLIPTAGVPFPLLSYGGTAAAVHIATLGLVLGLRAEGEKHRLWHRQMPQLPRLLGPAALLVTGCLMAMTGFAWNLQADHGPQLRRAGLTQMMRCVRIPAPRGEITDRHGAPLAIDVRQEQVDAVPALVRSAQVRTLAALTARSRTAVVRQLHRAHGLTVVVATLPPATAARVRAAHLAGVFLAPTTRRVYPEGALLGPVLGWTGVATPADVKRWPDLPSGAIVGRTGLEETYDPILRGRDGRQCVYVDPAGRPVAMGPSTPPVPGSRLRLTLDLGLQRELTRQLASALRGEPGQPRGDLGGAVVMNPKNGQVYAMASLPSYDDNVFGPPVHQRALATLSKQQGNPVLEHVTQVVAPPGSTFKLVVASADLKHPAIQPEEVIPTGGSWTLGDHTFHNWMVLPPQNLVQALAWSNDVYFYQLAWAMGPQPIITTARQLGVGAATGIDLPGESSGFLGTPSSVAKAGGTWYPGSTVVLGIGQGYLDVTPLQDALWTAGVTTGALVTPHLGLSYRSGSGFTRLPMPGAHPLSFADKLGLVRAGMRAAATSGTASILAALPVAAGGKTGSAQDPAAPSGGTDSWFTAAAPLHRPDIVATGFVRGGGEGVTTSGRVVLPAMEYFFAHRAAILRTGR
ncbi:FtsW/RodA/SpoVE family cell cycle protein [Nocardioides terrisoli]|uniref:FtsW/RodA/SpoVE family cell cycle protein n=1 Tax=Nocardioides terrisoli TaxID=3388267 RepID=UPI00287B95DD|nr:FtsW/RodA/SpoVE family cell cycle protein [Nocardioides marmorisolisilvae]